MKIIRMEAENIKKLRVVRITPQGNVIQITGPNGSGKTSVLDAIYFALGGAKDIPAQPIRRGQLKAHVTVELGEITVTRKFSKDSGTSLVVEAKNGSRFPSPQRMLDELLGKLTFDPLEFSRMEPRKQLEQLCAMVHVDVDLDELDRLNTGDFDKRTELNREIKMLDAQAGGITFPDDTPDEQIDTAALGEELRTAGARHAEALQVETKKRKFESDATSAREESDRHLGRVKEIEAHIDRLRQEIATEQGLAGRETDRAKDLQTQADAIKIPACPDTREITVLLDQAGSINQAIARKQEQGKLYAQAKKLRARVDELTEAMAGRTNRKQQAIAAAKMPIEGLSFGDGEVVFNSLPFGQASSAEQLRISVAVAMAANPKLRVLRITDGSLLDEKSMELLASMATADDYQIWIERVDTSGKVGVVMEEGEVTAVNK
jgi:DNA repair exonuclease SbcCD ATPase subunit